LPAKFLKTVTDGPAAVKSKVCYHASPRPWLIGYHSTGRLDSITPNHLRLRGRSYDEIPRRPPCRTVFVRL